MRIDANLAITAIVLFVSPIHIASQPNATATVRFPKNGEVSVVTNVRQGQRIRIQFNSSTTKQILLDANIGNKEDWTEFVDKDHPDELDMSARFLAIHRPNLPDPLIVVLARMQGASDCKYTTGLFGEVDGKISALSPTLPNYWTRGGTFLLTKSDKPVQLTVTSERYQDKDAHYTGPSRMAVFTYTYNQTTSKFLNTVSKEVKTDALHVQGEDLMKLFGTFPDC